MTKKNVLEKLRKAKLGHKRWISYAKAMHMGIEVDDKAIPMLETNCEFGKWYYNDGQVFSDLDSYQAIEGPHSLLHHTYMELYTVKNEPVKSGFLKSKSKMENEKKTKLDTLMDQLMHISRILLENLKEFESDIKNMNEFEFNKLI